MKKVKLVLMALPITLLLMSSCKKDPCESTICLNNGTCVNGQCNCTDGYTGSDCSQQVTPNEIKVTKVKITKFPATVSSGASWDLNSGPDIYIEILKGSSSLYTTSTYYENADPSVIYSFDLNPVLNLNEPNNEYSIRLYDYDTSSGDDYMGGIIFTPYSNTTGFPATLNLDAGGDVAFELTLSYVW